MSNFTNSFIITIAAAFLMLGFFVIPQSVSAQSVIDVDFETQPLFDVGNFLPEDTVVKTVTVTNNSDQQQTVEAAAAGVIDNDGLGDMLDIDISTPNGSQYSDTLADFLVGGNKNISDIDTNETITYTFSVYFEETAGNPYQGKKLGFDLCVGFSGGEEQCVAGGGADDGNDGDNGTSTDNGNGAGGGGGSNLLDRDGNGTPDEDDATPDNPEVAGVSTTSPPESNLSGLLSDLEDALRDLLASLREGGAVLGVLDRRPPSLPATGDGSFAGTEGGAKTTATAALFGGILLTLLVLLFASYRWHTTKKVN